MILTLMGFFLAALGKPGIGLFLVVVDLWVECGPEISRDHNGEGY